MFQVQMCKEFVCVCVFISKKTKTSPIFPPKMDDPISVKFCTTTRLRDVMIYSERISISLTVLYLQGVEFSIHMQIHMPHLDCSLVHPKLSSSGLVHVTISLSAVHWPSVRQSFSALMLSVISVSCWIVSCPCKATLARSPVHVSIISHGTTRYITRHFYFLALTTAILCSLPLFLHLYPGASATCTECGCSTRAQSWSASHITPALQQLHWLPVKYRIIFKIATLMHHILHNGCPSYLVYLVVFNTADSQRRQLRSSHTRAAVVKRTRTQFSKRAFSACGTNTLNSLPPAVRNIDSHPAFRQALKSHLFQCAFIV